MKSLTAKFQILDIFSIAEVGIVLSGVIIEGKVLTKNWICFDLDGSKLEYEIKGIDSNIIASQPKFGLLIKPSTLKEHEMLKSWNPNEIIGEIYSVDA